MNLSLITTLVATGVMYLQVQGCSTDSEDPDAKSIERRSATEEEYLIGADGMTRCILNDHASFAATTSFWHHDKNGECSCTICRIGQHVKSFCECEEGSDVPKIPTICGPVAIGQFMNQSNFCLVPYNCTASCLENQILVKNCQPDADIQCQCKEGWYNPDKMDTGNNPQECRLKPSCPNAGEELLANDGTDDEVTRTFSCQTCRDGHFKNEGDGECKPRRVCQTKAGNQFEDNQCLNDIPSVSDESLGNPPTQGLKIEKITRSDPDIEATTESTSQDVSQTTVPMPVDHATTDPGTKSDTCYCVVAWSVSATCLIASCVVCLVFGIWIYLQDRKQKKLMEQKDRPSPLLIGCTTGITAEGEDETVE